MATQEHGHNGEGGEDKLVALRAFVDELRVYNPEDAERFEKIEENLASGNVDADLSFLVRHLTERQVRYLLHYIETDGNWREAAKKAEYSPSAKQDQIEGGPAMTVCMTVAKSMVSRRILQRSPDAVKERVLRIALKAEQNGQLDTALRANVKLGEALGIFETKGTTVNFNADGVVIQISAPRAEAEEEDPALEAIWREVEADNYGPKGLPQGGEE